MSATSVEGSDKYLVYWSSALYELVSYNAVSVCSLAAHVSSSRHTFVLWVCSSAWDLAAESICCRDAAFGVLALEVQCGSVRASELYS